MKYIPNKPDHREGRKKTRKFSLLGWSNESQGKLSHAWILSFKQQKTNSVLGRQVVRSLLLPTTISIPIQHSKKKECYGRKCSKHCASKRLFL
jgi:hypothetical protein